MHTSTISKISGQPQPRSPKKGQRAFTLFVALLVSSMLLAVGLSLSNIIMKQLTFSTSGAASQLAFYAADSGAECALYWDRKDGSGATQLAGAFATSTVPSGVPSNDVGGQLDLKCGNGGGTNNPDGRVGGFTKNPITNTEATTTFSVDYSDQTTGHVACAYVTVAKWYDSSSGVSVEHTSIDSRGYNAPFSGLTGIENATVPIQANGQGGAGHCYLAGPRVVERAVRLDY